MTFLSLELHKEHHSKSNEGRPEEWKKINVKLIMEVRDAGLSRSTIASTRHISRHSVSDVFNIADEKGIRYSDIGDPDYELRTRTSGAEESGRDPQAFT